MVEHKSILKNKQDNLAVYDELVELPFNFHIQNRQEKKFFVFYSVSLKWGKVTYFSTHWPIVVHKKQRPRSVHNEK